MNYCVKSVVEFLKREDGPTAVECAVMLGLVVVMCIVANQQVKQHHPGMPIPEPVMIAR